MLVYYINNHRTGFLLFLVFKSCLCISCLNLIKLVFFTPKHTVHWLQSLGITPKCYLKMSCGPIWKIKSKEIYDLRLKAAEFSISSASIKNFIYLLKNLLISHCQTAWLKMNTVPLQLLSAETTLSRFAAAQPDGSKWDAPLCNQYGLEEKSIRKENLKVSSEGISFERLQSCFSAQNGKLGWEDTIMQAHEDQPCQWSPGWQKPFPKFRQQRITTRSPFLHRTKKGFLTNIQNVITLSEYSTAAVLVELESAVKEEAMCQLIKPDNSRTIPAGFDQLRFRDWPHDNCHLPTKKTVIFLCWFKT